LAAGLRLLEADEPGAAAEEGVTAEPALLDRLEQERRGGPLAQAEVRAERRDEIGRDDGGRVHGNEKRPSSGRTVERCGLFERLRAQAPAPLGAPEPPRARGEEHWTPA